MAWMGVSATATAYGYPSYSPYRSRRKSSPVRNYVNVNQHRRASHLEVPQYAACCSVLQNHHRHRGHSAADIHYMHQSASSSPKQGHHRHSEASRDRRPSSDAVLLTKPRHSQSSTHVSCHHRGSNSEHTSPKAKKKSHSKVNSNQDFQIDRTGCFSGKPSNLENDNDQSNDSHKKRRGSSSRRSSQHSTCLILLVCCIALLEYGPIRLTLLNS